MASDETLVTECAAQSCEEIVVGLQRGMKLRDSLAGHRVVDVQFADFMRDPFATISVAVRRTGARTRPCRRAEHARLLGCPSR